jgi:nitrite reductase (NO-forming)
VSAPPAASPRRCRPRPPLAPDALRPSDLLTAFFVPGIGFLIAGAVVAAVHAATGWAPGHWLSLHLIFVGGVSQLVLGAGQFFAGAFLATDPPGRGLARLQLGVWNSGTLLVAFGVPSATDAATIAGAALLAVGLGAFVAGLRGMRRRSLQRMPWAVRWYEACALFLGVGVLIGVLLATGVRWSAGSLLGAHMTLNLAGWFGTAIMGTLHTFFPSLTQTRLRFPQLQRPTFGCWALGTATLAGGYGFEAGPLVIAGWAALTLAAALLCANLIASLRAAPTPLSLPARLIAPAQACLMLALGLALAGALTGTPTAPPLGEARTAIAVLLLPGWLGLTVAGSLLHLLAVLARVRDLRRPLPAPLPARDRSLAGLALVGVLGLAAARGGALPALDTPATSVLAAAYLALGMLVAARAARALRAGRSAAPGFPTFRV